MEKKKPKKRQNQREPGEPAAATGRGGGHADAGGGGSRRYNTSRLGSAPAHDEPKPRGKPRGPPRRPPTPRVPAGDGCAAPPLYNEGRTEQLLLQELPAAAKGNQGALRGRGISLPFPSQPPLVTGTPDGRGHSAWRGAARKGHANTRRLRRHQRSRSRLSQQRPRHRARASRPCRRGAELAPAPTPSRHRAARGSRGCTALRPPRRRKRQGKGSSEFPALGANTTSEFSEPASESGIAAGPSPSAACRPSV